MRIRRTFFVRPETYIEKSNRGAWFGVLGVFASRVVFTFVGHKNNQTITNLNSRVRTPSRCGIVLLLWCGQQMRKQLYLGAELGGRPETRRTLHAIFGRGLSSLADQNHAPPAFRQPLVQTGMYNLLRKYLGAELGQGANGVEDSMYGAGDILADYPQVDTLRLQYKFDNLWKKKDPGAPDW